MAWIGLPAAQAVRAIEACGPCWHPVRGGAGRRVRGDRRGRRGGAGAPWLRTARGAGVRPPRAEHAVGFAQRAGPKFVLTFSTIGKLEQLVPGPVAVLSQSGRLGGCLLDRATPVEPRRGPCWSPPATEADLPLAHDLDWLVEAGPGARASHASSSRSESPQRVRAAVQARRPEASPSSRSSLARPRPAPGPRAPTPGPWRVCAARAAGAPGRGRRVFQRWSELDHLVETGAHSLAVALAGRTWPWRRGRRLAVLVADALDPRGFTFAPLAEETVERVSALLPPTSRWQTRSISPLGCPTETFGEVPHRRPGIRASISSSWHSRSRAGGSARAEHVIKAASPTSKPLVGSWWRGTRPCFLSRDR